jgi:hypothetical protein
LTRFLGAADNRVLKLPAESSTWVELPLSGLFQLLADLEALAVAPGLRWRAGPNVGVAGGGNGAGEVVPFSDRPGT